MHIKIVPEAFTEFYIAVCSISALSLSAACDGVTVVTLIRFFIALIVVPSLG